MTVMFVCRLAITDKMASILYQAQGTGLRDCVFPTPFSSTTPQQITTLCMTPSLSVSSSTVFTSSKLSSVFHKPKMAKCSAKPKAALEAPEAAVEAVKETLTGAGEVVKETALKIIAPPAEEKDEESADDSRGGNIKADPLKIIMFQVLKQIPSIRVMRQHSSWLLCIERVPM